MADPLDVLLRVGFHHAVTAANADEARQRVQALAGGSLDTAAFHDAVAAAVAADLIRDPIRLPPGGLQCHWRLELTPAGVQRARALSGA
ncbi:conserved protein of unknown function [Rhodovastum atsumiense]|uniref:Uncharacterized protein n=1 Tax=Rhodovastum atsumiense TaxID=504468 RepID=A0A5M6IMS3_9PROT|nr:hypothetical protein [Rhodovastum atsumiense]KAA5609542.1 hypothetical protein F1189_23705 [Rhodovastum atsumiense]CAH2604929.1 conserved protein of unknown function [Rhodovastum atsumiense]